MSPTAPQRRLLAEDGALDMPTSPAGSPVKVSGGVTPSGAPTHVSKGVTPAERPKRKRRFKALIDLLNKYKKTGEFRS